MIPAEFFDIFGFFAFILIFLIGYRIRKREKKYSGILMILGAVGIIADGYIVIQNIIAGIF